MMKASFIYNKAKEEITAFALSQFEHIRDWNIRIGLWDKITDEEDYYTIDTSDYDLGEHYVRVDVMDTYSLDFYEEKRRIEEIRLYNDGIALKLEHQPSDEPVYLHTFSMLDLVNICNYLEMVWQETINPKK